MRGGVRPFLVPPADSWLLGPWQRVSTSEISPLEAAISDWDPNLELDLVRTVSVDVERCRRGAGLDASAAIDLVVSWQSSAAYLRGTVCRMPLDQSGRADVAGSITGHDLGGSLTLSTRLILGASHGSNGFTAWLPGTVLLEDTASVRLEGDAGQFPISAADFSLMGLPERARWHLVVPTDVHEATLGTVRLLLNSQDQELMGAASNAAKPTNLQRQLLLTLEQDLTRQLVELALDHSSELEHTSPESFGNSLSALVSVLFDQDAVSLASQRISDRPRFATDLQDAIARRAKAPK